MGLDHIRATAIKLATHILAQPLSEAIDLSFRTGPFPEALKTAAVTPIHKSESKQVMAIYRPVSVLTTISKVYDCTYYNHIYHYLNSYNLINGHQCGF